MAKLLINPQRYVSCAPRVLRPEQRRRSPADRVNPMPHLRPMSLVLPWQPMIPSSQPMAVKRNKVFQYKTSSSCMNLDAFFRQFA